MVPKMAIESGAMQLVGEYWNDVVPESRLYAFTSNDVRCEDEGMFTLES